jgi:hypothetical protein
MFVLLNPFHPAWLSLHLIKYHTHKDVWGSGSIILSILKLGPSVQLHVLAASAPGKSPCWTAGYLHPETVWTL